MAVGYGIARWGNWPDGTSEGLSRFVFSVALPALLFHLMAGLSKLPPVDARLLVAFFGGCVVVFVVGRLVAWRALGLGGAEQSLVGIGGVFSNNVLLGLPMATAVIGRRALPSVALLLVFNALLLWTLVTASVEWARGRGLGARGLLTTGRSVVTNPVVAAILLGTAYGLTGLPLPGVVETPLSMTADAAAPMALVSLGMSLVEYPVRAGWRISATIAALKLALQPLVVWLIAVALGLPRLETQVVVLLASISVGANVYLMARRFQVLEGPVAAAIVLSTALSALTTPVAITLVGV